MGGQSDHLSASAKVVMAEFKALAGLMLCFCSSFQNNTEGE
jgi:hypothetical protein